MAITRFEDLPSTNTSINSEHLNENFDELGVKVGTSVDNNYRVNVLHSKNLLNYTIPLTTNLGVTISMIDGRLILDGTTTGAGYIYDNTTNTILLKAGTYTISATKISGTYQKNNVDTAINISKTSDKTVLFNAVGENDYSKVTTITLTEDTLIKLNIYTNGDGMVFTNLVVSLQIERGSTATDFEIPVTPSIYVDGETIYTKGQNEVYSTAEQRIGTWIDGKPIYRKVIDIPILTAGDYTYNVSSLNIATVLCFKGYCTVANQINTYRPLPYTTFNSNINQFQGCWVESYEYNNITVKSNWDNSVVHLIIEYTKTTDA